MDMHYNNQHFTLIFYEKNSNTEKKVKNFFGEEDDLFKANPSVTIKENTDVQLLFDSNIKSARLYMDGLETLPEKFLENDEYGIPFRYPSKEKFVLFKNQDEYYPLIPGKYQAQVNINEDNFYFVIEIVPKRITNKQLDTIKNDLEIELKGLAQDLIRKNIGLGLNNYNLMPSKYLYKFLVIRNNFNEAMNALTDLYTKINYRVQKKYRYVNSTKSCNMDEVTIKNMLANTKDDNYIKVPYKTFNYNLLENQWIKIIIKDIFKILSHFETIVKKYLCDLENDIKKEEEYQYKPNVKAIIKEKNRVLEDLKKYYFKARKIRNAFSIIEATSWYKKIDTKIVNNVPYVMFADPRYRVIYKLYKELKKDEIKVKLDTAYSYNWKRTDKLYEMWGYIKLYKLLINERMNFKIDGGWIFSKSEEDVDYIIPLLKSGTSIKLYKDNMVIRLVYDEKLPLTSKEAQKDNSPLYTIGSHTRPDVRMDVYIDEIYVGSIIVDFKYRNPQYIWNMSGNRTDAMRQLISYSSDLQSICIFGDKLNKNLRNQIKPVKEVWAIYPNDKTNKEQRFYEDPKVALIKMCPGVEYEYIEERLKCVLGEMGEVYKVFKI